MSGAAYEGFLAGGVAGTAVGIVAIVGVFCEDVGRLWKALAVAVFLASAAAIPFGVVGSNRLAEASQHRECFTVISVDTGQGFLHSPEVYAAPHSFHPADPDMPGTLVPGRHYCGQVQNSSAHSDPVLVSVERG